MPRRPPYPDWGSLHDCHSCITVVQATLAQQVTTCPKQPTLSFTTLHCVKIMVGPNEKQDSSRQCLFLQHQTRCRHALQLLCTRAMLSRIIVPTFFLILHPYPIEQRIEVHVLQRVPSCTDACLALLRLLPLLLLASLLTPASDCRYNSDMKNAICESTHIVSSNA